jgi:DNA (cytosine-5)-methyltransferase 1
MKLNILDLFSGCGGFGLGAELSGFHTHAAIDIDANLQSSYHKNFPSTHVINGDLKEFSSVAWKFITGDKIIDGIIGGPPCQGFSRMGKKSINDPRNSLIFHYFRHIFSIRPKFFIMENVEGILDKGSKELLNAAINSVSGFYNILGPITLDASDYGAPTSRKRVVVIGYNPEYVDEVTYKDLFPKIKKIKTTVREAIFDLPSPNLTIESSNEYGWGSYKSFDVDSLSRYAIKMRAVPKGKIGWKDSIDYLKKGVTSGHFNTAHSSAVIERYSNVAQGKVDIISKFPRLKWDGLCPTLRAGTGSDKGSFQAARPIHPEQPRVITIREAARLQGFPDWFIFHNTKWHSFRMIGNSVSPVLSTFLLKMMKNKISYQTETDELIYR